MLPWAGISPEEDPASPSWPGATLWCIWRYFITNVHLLDFNLKSDFCLSSIIFLPRSLREKKCGFTASRGDFAVNILEHGCSCKKIKLYNSDNYDFPGCWKTEVRNLDRPELHFHRGWLAKRNKKRWMEFLIHNMLPAQYWPIDLFENYNDSFNHFNKCIIIFRLAF